MDPLTIPGLPLYTLIYSLSHTDLKMLRYMPQANPQLYTFLSSKEGVLSVDSQMGRNLRDPKRMCSLYMLTPHSKTELRVRVYACAMLRQRREAKQPQWGESIGYGQHRTAEWGAGGWIRDRMDLEIKQRKGRKGPHTQTFKKKTELFTLPLMPLSHRTTLALKQKIVPNTPCGS